MYSNKHVNICLSTFYFNDTTRRPYALSVLNSYCHHHHQCDPVNYSSGLQKQFLQNNEVIVIYIVPTLTQQFFFPGLLRVNNIELYY